MAVLFVVHPLPADDDAPGNVVRTRFLGRPVAVSPEVADAVDDTRRPERDPSDLRNEDQRARNDAEQHDVGGAHQSDAEYREAGVDVALEPVVGRPVAIAGHRVAVVGFFYVQEHAGPEHAIDPDLLRTVRIFSGFAFGVVLAVNRSPLLRYHARRHPQP